VKVFHIIMIAFTRLLYAYDEVIVNLMFAILEKKDFNKVIFWSAELFYSGFLRELSELFWLFYYDFYTFNVPFYKINSKFKKFKNLNQFEALLESFYILFQAEPTCDMFIINYMIKIKKVAKINNIQNIFNVIECLLKTNKIHHIINYLRASLEQNETETIKHYNIFIKKVNKKSPLYKKNKYSSDVFSQLMNHFIIYADLLIIKKKRKRMKWMSLSETHIQYFKKLNINHHSIQIIQEQRKYAIDDFTSIFYLERQLMEKPMTYLFWYQWEYYTKNTPYWKEKYSKYDVQWNEENKSILFSNDDKLEEFYDYYDYELDELSFETSNKSIKTINNNISILEFLFKYFKVINIPLQKNKIDIKKKVKYYNNKLYNA